MAKLKIETVTKSDDVGACKLGTTLTKASGVFCAQKHVNPDMLRTSISYANTADILVRQCVTGQKAALLATVQHNNSGSISGALSDPSYIHKSIGIHSTNGVIAGSLKQLVQSLYLAIIYNDENDDILTSMFHKYIATCFGILGTNDYAQTEHGFSLRSTSYDKEELLYTFYIDGKKIVTDGISAYAPHYVEKVLNITEEDCRVENRHYYLFKVVFTFTYPISETNGPAQHTYESYACSKDSNPLLDIESCIDAIFEIIHA